MKVFVSIILAVVVYIGGGWIAKDIYIASLPLNGSKTLLDIAQEEIIIYAAIACVYNVICELIDEDDSNHDMLLLFGCIPWGSYFSVGMLYLIAWEL